ncbi:hypothetical protein RclHR1_03490012 [Rhizophagus clarus]|uniref:Kinase-like domain-containing protein n=1 Tax=Rhizophagus clarus TaxID=94130 RepID=A0A2Z6RBM5_9GLOM|nr:hypothetical protein RclHR1_03490012 [Rhizophagus clarus]GES89831.1 kinase-like domain-containing protein [Rhizophagus clarus]
MDSSNLNEDWYQTAIKTHGIKEITENFGKKDRIGQGSSCYVYKTKCESLGGILVAIKEVNITSDERIIKTFVNELKICNRIDNGRIIRFYGLSRNVEEKLYYLVLEYANQGTLRQFIKCNKNDFKWEERKCLATQIAEGVRYLHDELNIAHRDLHTKNILINDGNVKISDFGLSKNLDSIDTSNNKIVGILPFIDPQKFIDKKYVLDKSSDIYSLGVVLWEISSCCEPFPDEEKNYLLTFKICHGEREKPVNGTPLEYIQIYTSCWQLDPKIRPSISKILTILQSVSFESVFEGDIESPKKYLLSPPSVTSNHSTSEYSSGISLLIIPDNINIPPKKDISNSPNSFSANTTICKRCGQQFMDHYWWCQICEAQTFQDDFSNWTSGDKDLDELIKNSQLNATKPNSYFEWVNYNRFENIIQIIKGSYCEIYKATWLDGIREKWDNETHQWVRTKPVQIILREFRFESTIKNLKLHLEIENVIRCYGFTQNPETKRYYMVLKYANCGNFRQYIWRKFPFSWVKRLSILQEIVKSLNNIHEANYIHRDLYPGNILIHKDNWDRKLEVYISELDSCANLNSKIEHQQYGNLPYITPEVIRGNGNLTCIKSDIYSLGIIMWELASGDEPYSDYEIDSEDKLIRDIIDGVRPNDVIGTPKCYHELMKKCLDNDPEKRPTTQDLLQELHTFTTTPFNKQFERADQEIHGQPLGTRPDQLSKNNVEIVSKKTIDVAASYSGTTSFRFTNKLLSDFKF